MSGHVPAIHTNGGLTQPGADNKPKGQNTVKKSANTIRHITADLNQFNVMLHGGYRERQTNLTPTTSR